MKRRLVMTIAVLVLTLGFEGLTHGAHEGATGQVNVNTATKDELAWFLWKSGIGDSAGIAENIVEYRKANGPFRDIDDLRNVRGIDDYAFGQIRLWIKLQGETDYEGNDEGNPPGYPYLENPSLEDNASKGRFPGDEPYGPWRTSP